MDEAYGTDEGYAAYCLARGYNTSTLDPDDIAPARLTSSEWIDAVWRSSFPGGKTGFRAQVREWPRIAAYDVNLDAIGPTVIPREVEYATYEATRKVLEGVSLSVDYTPSIYKRVSVDGAVSAEFASYGTAGEVQTKFTSVERALSNILTGNAATVASYSGGAWRV